MKGKAVVVALLVVVSVAPSGVAAGGNEAPLADAGLDQEAEVGETVLLDAAGSRDPDGRIAAYEWHIETPGGTTVRPADPADPRTRFVVREPGRYDVTVAVTGDDGATAADTLYVYVTGGDESESAAGTSESSSSSSGMSVVSTSGPAGGAAVAGPTDSGLGVTPWINVSGPGAVKVGETAVFTATVGGFDGAPTVTWTSGDSGRAATVLFRSPGSYTVTAYASDGEETVSDSATVRVVRNQPPTVDVRVPENLEPGEAVTLSAEASDPDGRVVRRVWSPGQTVTVPDDRSRKTVTVTVHDDDGATARDTIAITGGEYITQDGPTQVKCAPKPQPSSKYVCEIDGERRVYQGREWADKAPEWRKSDEYELDEVSSDHLNSNADLVTQKPEKDLAGHVAGRYLSDRTIQTRDNSVTETNSQKKVDAEETMEPHTHNDKTVSADLTGDGEINAADWGRKHGKPEQNPAPVRESLTAVKQHQRAIQTAARGRGESVKQTDRRSAGTARDSDAGSTDGESSDPSASSDTGGSSGADSDWPTGRYST